MLLHFKNLYPRAKEFAKEFAQLTAKFNLKWKKKKLSECKLQQDFPMSKDQVVSPRLEKKKNPSASV